MHIHIRLPKTLGCTVASTAVLQAIKTAYPDRKIAVYTDNAELIEGLECVSVIRDAEEFSLKGSTVDLYDYMNEKNALSAESHKHLIDHMYDIAEESLGILLIRKKNPRVVLSDQDEVEAKSFLKSIYEGKPIVWLQKKTSTIKKDWLKESWDELLSETQDKYTFLNLDKRFGKRQAMAITKFCSAGITLDSFLSHGSEAVGAKNVIILLTSTLPEVVTYPDQIVLYSPNDLIGPDQAVEALQSLFEHRPVPQP